MHARLRFGLAMSAALWLGLTGLALAEPARPLPVQVMIVGTFHFDNPGLDYRNMKADDMLAPGRQKEIAAIATALSRFKPTMIGLEWADEDVAAAYPKYLKTGAGEDRSEIVQLGFRVAHQSGATQVRGLDYPMELPFEAVFDYAKAHDQGAFIDELGRVSDANVTAQENALKTSGVAATLRLLNDPVAAMQTHGLYRETLKIGGGKDQPGVAAVLAWYERNLRICANLLQDAKPGDRVIVFFGAGHLPLLRQCVQETPGYELVEARDFLPQ